MSEVLNPNVKVLVVVYAPDSVLPDFLSVFFQAIFGIRTAVMVAVGNSQWEAYNSAIGSALKGNFTHVWFVNREVRPPRKALHYLLQAGAGAISGAYYHPAPPHSVYAYMRGQDGTLISVEPQRSGRVAVDALGAGCLLVSVDVLRQVKGPWFVETYNEDGTMHEGPESYFSRLLRSVGASMGVDFDVQCRHAHVGFVSEEDAHRDWARWKKLVENEPGTKA